MQIPADDIVRQSLKLKVMSYKSSLNWNVTITVGVISLLLSFRGGLMCTFTFMSRLFRGKRREPRVALANCFSVSKCTFNLFKMRHRITFTFFFLSLTIDPHHETKCQRQSQADFLNRGGGGGLTGKTNARTHSKHSSVNEACRRKKVKKVPFKITCQVTPVTTTVLRAVIKYRTDVLLELRRRSPPPNYYAVINCQEMNYRLSQCATVHFCPPH